MARLPYGGFDAGEFDRDNRDPDPLKAWAKLNTVREYLEDGEALPPELARWLGEAIRYAAPHVGTDSNVAAKEFTQRLGLTVGRGNKDSQDQRWLVYGGMMDRLCAPGCVDAALAETHAVMVRDGHKPVRDTMLKKWRDKYRRIGTKSDNIL